jgi:hypothetical protein
MLCAYKGGHGADWRIVNVDITIDQDQRGASRRIVWLGRVDLACFSVLVFGRRGPCADQGVIRRSFGSVAG